MTPAQPAFRPRPGGGFNSGLGQFNEHLDENAFKAASSQKQLTQQTATDPATVKALAQAQNMQSGAAKPQDRAPRPVGSLAQELVTRPIGDGLRELRQFLSANAWLGLDVAKDPQEQAKQRQIMQRFSQLTQEQQAVARRNYEERLQKQRQEEQEEEQRKQMKAQQEQQELQMPASSQKGPVGPAGSKKQRAVTKLQRDRQQLNGPAGAN